jgi:hypothetical protein
MISFTGKQDAISALFLLPILDRKLRSVNGFRSRFVHPTEMTLVDLVVNH